MAPASPSLHSDSSRLKWKKRKRESNLKKRKTHDDDDDDDEDEEEAAMAAEDDDQGPSANDLGVDFRESEAVEEGVRVSDFPFVLQRAVKRPHATVLAIVAAERCTDPRKRPKLALSIENISHGQLQSLSAVLPDNPSLSCQVEPDKPHTYVCMPPDLMEANGVVKRFGKLHALVVPAHADWFDPRTVHRQERQVVPHYFSGKSADHTPDKYLTIRNTIVAKYMENPRKRLSLAECQGIVSTKELFDLSRIVRFLDNWGIINYMAEPVYRGPRVSASLVREEFNGELQVNTAPLKSIDSLVLFDRPRSSLKTEDVSSLASPTVNYDEEIFDFDSRIREQLSNHSCNYCLRHLFTSYYQSRKEADTVLCPECYHDAKFLIGHSSLDFVRMDYQMDSYDGDGDSWTDHETLLLLEALEKYSDNWDEVAGHVGTKSKAQCIVHFIRLQTEDSVLEKIEFPQVPFSSNDSNEDANGIVYANSNGPDLQDDTSENQLPFSNASNPIMSLVAFLAVCLGPRMAASCACAALSILTKDDSNLEPLDRTDSGTLHLEDGLSRELLSPGNQRDNSMGDQGLIGETGSSHPLCPEKVKHAAAVGLTAAAVKTKLFADQEEREIQRLSATIINHQLKRLELKLKQFAEIETLLLKECEQVERARQRLYGERVRIISAKFGQTMPPPSSSSMPPIAPPPASTMNMSARPPGPVSLGGGTATVQGNIIPPGYGNNLVSAHPQMAAAFMQSQAAMFPYVGPRLPLSAIHPSSSSQSSSMMIPSSSGAPAAAASLANHNLLLRSLSNNNSNMGQG